MTDLKTMRRIRLLALAALLALTGSACAGAAMDADLGQHFAVNVVNEMPHPMIVALDDGTMVHRLGTVGAETESRFVLDGGLGTTVTIVATDEADTHTVRRTVVLRAGRTVEVRIN